MFKIGETVRNVARNVVGVVVEIDGDTVYVEQENGCEVDFPASALISETAYQEKHGASARDDAPSRENDAVYEAVLANLYPAIVEIGQHLHAETPPVPGIAAKSWGALSPLQKLNIISNATDVPVKAWIDANQPGAKVKLGTLQISVLSARGESARG